MKEKEGKAAQQIGKAIDKFAHDEVELPGLNEDRAKNVLIEQLIESQRRVRYVEVISERDISPKRLDPKSDLFDPIKAAILRQRAGEIEEAFWLVFLFVHFGKNLKSGYRLARDVYGALGAGPRWTWAAVKRNPEVFREWLRDNCEVLKGADGVKRSFGNHRKRESLNDDGTGETVESYVNWVAPHRTHSRLFLNAVKASGGDPSNAFDSLYNSMKSVHRFGRTAKFDYLSMIGKLELAPIEAGSTYLKGATGPLSGARLLFGGSHNCDFSAVELEKKLIRLGFSLGVGMHVLEDALCNWQKSPQQLKRFRG